MRRTKIFHPFNENEELIMSPLQETTRVDHLLWALLLGVMGAGAYAYSRQFTIGLGVTGMNRPVYWGVYITNFVFFHWAGPFRHFYLGNITGRRAGVA